MMPLSLESLLNKAKQNPKKRTVAIAAAEDISVIQAALGASKMGLIKPVFIGDKEVILRTITENKITLGEAVIEDMPNPLDAVKLAVSYVKSGEIDILMKGLIPTKDLLKVVVHKERGIAINSILSHLGLFEIPGFNRLIGVTDAAMNIAPDLDEKVQIIKNAVECFNKLGNQNPKVALLAAISKLNSKMHETISANEVTNLHGAKAIGKCEIQGPLALDVAISEHAATHKGFNGAVAGNADLLVVPEITSGNILYKSLTYFAHAIPAGIVLGAKSPIILTSRSDSAKSKLYSIALAHCLC